MTNRSARSGHGRRHRDLRGPVQGPDLPAPTDRRDDFALTVGQTAEYLISLWPERLEQVSVEIADVPWTTLPHRWYTNQAERRIVLFRLPIERSGQHRSLDPHQAQALIEFYVFRAFSEYLGKDPWDIAPGRYKHR